VVPALSGPVLSRTAPIGAGALNARVAQAVGFLKPPLVQAVVASPSASRAFGWPARALSTVVATMARSPSANTW
jgi:hypothetical protein